MAYRLNTVVLPKIGAQRDGNTDSQALGSGPRVMAPSRPSASPGAALSDPKVSSQTPQDLLHGAGHEHVHEHPRGQQGCDRLHLNNNNDVEVTTLALPRL